MTTPRDMSRDDVLRVLGDSGLDGLESLFRLLERAEPLFARFSERIMKIKEWEAAHGPDQVQDQDYAGDYADGYGVYTLGDGDQPEASPARPAPPRAETPAPPKPELTPINLYQMILGELANLPQEMTIKDALAMAKEHKPMVLSALEDKMKELL